MHLDVGCRFWCSPGLAINGGSNLLRHQSAEMLKVPFCAAFNVPPTRLLQVRYFLLTRLRSCKRLGFAAATPSKKEAESLSVLCQPTNPIGTTLLRSGAIWSLPFGFPCQTASGRVATNDGGFALLLDNCRWRSNTKSLSFLTCGKKRIRSQDRLGGGANAKKLNIRGLCWKARVDEDPAVTPPLLYGTMAPIASTERRRSVWSFVPDA